MSTTARAPATEEEFLAALYKGGELLAAGKVVEARQHLEKANGLAPKNEKAQNLLGLTYFKLGLFDQASAVYERLVRENPADPTLRVNLGLVYLKTNDLPRCVKEFETATDLDPDHKKAHNYLGLALAQAGDYAKAKEHFILAGSDLMADKMSKALVARVESAPASQPVVVPAPRDPPPLAVTGQPAQVVQPPLPADDAIEVMSDDQADVLDADAVTVDATADVFVTVDEAQASAVDDRQATEPLDSERAGPQPLQADDPPEMIAVEASYPDESVAAGEDGSTQTVQVQTSPFEETPLDPGESASAVEDSATQGLPEVEVETSTFDATSIEVTTFDSSTEATFETAVDVTPFETSVDQAMTVEASAFETTVLDETQYPLEDTSATVLEPQAFVEETVVGGPLADEQQPATATEPMPDEVEIATPMASGPRLERDWGSQFGMDEPVEVPAEASVVTEADLVGQDPQHPWVAPVVNSWNADAGAGEQPIVSDAAVVASPADVTAPVDATTWQSQAPAVHEPQPGEAPAPAEDLSWNVPPDPANEMDFAGVAPEHSSSTVAAAETWEAAPEDATAAWQRQAQPTAPAETWTEPAAAEPAWAEQAPADGSAWDQAAAPATPEAASWETTEGAPQTAWNTTAAAEDAQDTPPGAADPRWDAPVDDVQHAASPPSATDARWDTPVDDVQHVASPPSATDARWDTPVDDVQHVASPPSATAAGWDAPVDDVQHAASPPSATAAGWDAPVDDVQHVASPPSATAAGWDAPVDDVQHAASPPSATDLVDEPQRVASPATATDPRWDASAEDAAYAEPPSATEPAWEASPQPPSEPEEQSWVAQPLSEFAPQAHRPSAPRPPSLSSPDSAYAPMQARTLQELGNQQSYLEAPEAGPFHLGPHGLAITVAGEMLTRMTNLVAIVGSVTATPEHRRKRGRAIDQPFGVGPTQLQRLVGHGLVHLETGGSRFHALDLDDEGAYLVEPRVFGFQEVISFENGHLADEGSPVSLDLVHLTGAGRVLLQLEGALKSLALPPGAPMVVPLSRLVGWFGHVTPRLTGFAGQGAVELTGQGSALLVAPG